MAQSTGLDWCSATNGCSLRSYGSAGEQSRALNLVHVKDDVIREKYVWLILIVSIRFD